MLLATVGGILAAIGLIWGVVIGYYPSELPALIGTLGSGALLLFIGSRMIASTKPTTVEWQPSSAIAPVPAAAPVAPVAPVQAAEPALEPGPGPALAPVASSTVIDDATVAVPRRRRTPHWTVELPNGTTTLVREQVLLGRAPQPSAEHPRAELVVVDDASVSKSHALLGIFDGALQVLDLESANGTFVVVDDVENRCVAGEWMTVPDGATLEIGTVELVCSSTSSREVNP